MAEEKTVQESAAQTPLKTRLADPIALTRQLSSMVDKRYDILRRIGETGLSLIHI